MLVENEFKKLKAFDSSYFVSKIHFEEDDTQNYLVFQPMYRYSKRIAVVLVMAITFVTGNLKDCMTKEIILLKHPIIVLLHS